MERITLCLWFDGQAENAARFYGSAFGSFAMGRVTRYDKVFAEVSGQPEGSVMTVSFELDGYELVGLNGGPRFDFTPAVSLHVGCESEEEVDRLHETLSDEGEILMPLQEYPFSPKYCWLSDRHGLSWQIDLAPRPQRITPALLFVGEQAGRAEEAVELYTSLFDGSEIHALERWEPGDPDPGEGTVKSAEFSLSGQRFRAMDSSLGHDFTFNEATSFMVECRGQDEVDRYWSALTRAGEEGRCGWLKDPFGVSWQVVPTALDEMLRDDDSERVERVSKALLEMTKPVIGALEAAYRGG